MAHKKAALKHIRQTKKRTDRNMAVKKNLMYLKRQILKMMVAKDKPKASDLVKQYIKAVDKAAGRNILTMNTAARKKSRMIAHVNTMK